jgi:beta-lactamase regulating signal transducer with metallopeptidase domain
MNPDLLLAVVTALTGFVLKTTLAFGVCWVLSWLADSPSRRFIVWLSFLYGTAAYWLFLATSIVPFPVPGPVIAVPSYIPYQAVRETVPAWQIPSSWAFPLGVALRLLGVIYLLVLTYMLVAHIKKHFQLKWVLSFTSQPPDEVVAAFQPIARNLGVGRSRLLVLAGVTSPATFGCIRPTILLPDTCLEQDRSGLEDILRHELHHVRRLDFVWNGLAIACRALLFFHPAAWYAVSRMQFNRELACDLAAVSDSPKRRARYAECLIHFARLNSSQSSNNWGIDFASSSEHLKARVHSILAETKKSPAWLIGSRIACGLALLAGFVAIEPSLGVLLTYAQRQIAPPLAAEIRTAPPKVDTRMKPIRKGRLSRGESLASAPLPVANVSQTPDSTDFPAPGNADISASTQGDGGPQLLHRGSAAPAKAARQTVIPIDDASGQTSKAGDHDHQKALQQTATAVSVLKRLSTFDRR